jgi:hypothetical protein
MQQLMQLSKVGFSQASLGFAAVSGDAPVLGETPSFYALLHAIKIKEPSPQMLVFSNFRLKASFLTGAHFALLASLSLSRYLQGLLLRP